MAEEAFVARDRELAQLSGFLDRALDGHGQICFVTGNAGSGKTALATEFARRTQKTHRDLLVAIGTCNAQTGMGDPYLPFRELLGLLTGDVDDELARGAISQENARRLRAFLLRSAQVLIELGPDLVGALVPGSRLIALVGKVVVDKVGWMDQLDALASRKQGQSRVGELLTEQRRIFEQYTQVLKSLAAEQPLMLMVDDLQWADTASISLLFHLGRRIGESRILLVGIYRPADVALGRGGDRHPLESVIHELKRYHGDIGVDLDQTVADEGRRFVDSLLDTEPNRLGEQFRQALYQHTDGHPLFTVELLKHMQEGGDLQRDDSGRWVEGQHLDWGALPARVEGVIAERIGRLGQDLRDILTVAGVQGEEFTAEVIAQVQAMDRLGLVRRLSRELEAQHRLVRAQGIRRLKAQRLSLYRFWHNLFQRYLYNMLDEAERAYLHEEVGLVLEALYADEADEITLQLARHFEAAGMAEKAIAYLCEAGEQAQALYAPREAVAHLARALEIAGRSSIPPPFGLYRVRGQAYETLGEFDHAHSDFTAALEVARREADQQAEWQALLDLGELWASRDYVQTGEYYQQALALARAMDDAACLAHTLNRMGNWHLNAEQPRQALRYHEEALSIFQEMNDRRGVAETLDLLGMASLLGGDLVRSTAYFEGAVALFRELDDRLGLVSSLASVMGSWDYLSDTMFPGAAVGIERVSHGEAALEMAREINYRSGEAYILPALASSLGPLGEYARALAYAREGLDLAEAIEHHQWMAMAHCTLGALYLDLLALPRAREHLERGLALAKDIGSLFWIRCVTGFLTSTYIRQGELARAEALLDSAVEPDSPFETMGQRLVGCARAELALAAGEADLALQITDQLIASALNLGPEQTIPRLSKLRGEALMALHRTEQAEAELLAAREMARAQGVRPLQWRIHQALGNLYQGMDRPEAAGRELLAARTIIRDLAAKVPDQALRHEFLHCADPPPSAPVAPMPEHGDVA